MAKKENAAPIKKVVKKQAKKTVPTTKRRRSTTTAAKKRRTSPSKGASRMTLLKERAKVFLKRLLWNRITQSLLALSIAIIGLYGAYCMLIRPYSYRWMPCYGNKSYGICMPFKYAIHGLDVSRHQGEILWDSIMANNDPISPLHFVFIKATEGGDFKDVNYTKNFEEAKRVNLIRGAYHFFTPKTSAKKQAEFFIQNVKLDKGDLPPVLDVEVAGKHNAKTLSERVLTWLKIVEKHYNVKPILYTSYKFKTRYLNDSVFNDYPFWIAHYYVGKVRYTGEWKFWQHSDIGQVEGIDHDVDLNVFNGTKEELKALTIP